MPALEHTNRLINEKSPYLLQHAHNPVDWYPWSDEAFAKAKAEDKPVFLSIGYSACHWCHVMEKECFEDEEAAALLNRYFVSVKVDREERPDVDHFYMEACAALTGGGGWPLSCFLAPDRRPFFAGTYFPKEDGLHGAGFLTLLRKIHEIWRENREALLASAEAVTDALREKQPADGQDASPGEAVAGEAAAHLLAGFDEEYGGFSGAPKFPMAQSLLLLMGYGGASALRAAQKTLRAMRSGGIYDQIGGGFFRYSTDRRWRIPHFEKMIADNALLLMVYTWAGALLGPDFFETARGTAEFCLREMRLPGGGFASSLDADSDGGEGNYYLFTPEQAEEALGREDGARWCALFDVTQAGNFEGRSVPGRADGHFSPEDAAFSNEAAKKLLLYRNRRTPPFRDDKVLTGGNGLMIAALAQAGSALREDRYIRAAADCADFVLQNAAPGGRLRSGWRKGEIRALATADDYAFLIGGFLELYEATFETVWLDRAVEWTSRMDALFLDGEGGYALTGADATGLPFRQTVLADGAGPSGNAAAAWNLVRLARLTGDGRFEKAANRVINCAAPAMNRVPEAFCGLLLPLLWMRTGGREIVLADGEGFETLVDALPPVLPFAVRSACGGRFAGMDRLAPFTDEYRAIRGRAAAYVCQNGACRPPVTSPEELRAIFTQE